MVRSDVIIRINDTIIVGIVFIHGPSGNISDVVTGPGVWAVEWTVTIDMTETITIGISPFVFTIHNTLVDFTSFNNSIVIFITVFHKEFVMIGIDRVVHIDGSRSVSIISLNGFLSDFVDHGTVPSSITSDWTVTFNMTGLWTVSISPLVFHNNDTGVHFTHVDRSVKIGITGSSNSSEVIVRDHIVFVDVSVRVGIPFIESV